MYDLLIVGQGLAGTMLSHFALKRNLSFRIIDFHNPNAASNVASGVVNPITGRKMLKTWLADTVIPFAKNTYLDIENKLGVPLIEQLPILKVFSSQEDVATWNKNKLDVEYKNYLGNIIDCANRNINSKYGVGQINETFWLDTKILIKAYKTYFLQNNRLENAKFNFDELVIENYINYKNINYKNIIFCEGYQVINNPFFNFIPIKTAKGEQLRIKAEELKINSIINKNIFIIPAQNDEYYVGSNYIWNDMDEKVTVDGKNEILQKLEKTIHCPYTILEEKAGIRPTIKDRRPAIGRHKTYKNVYVFNGLGTKGISLSPYFAEHLLSHITSNEPLLDEINVARFYP